MVLKLGIVVIVICKNKRESNNLFTLLKDLFARTDY